MRPEVQMFAMQLETRLRENDHKGGWDSASVEWLVRRMALHFHKLEDAALTESPEAVLSKVLDVAGYGIMVADQVQRGQRGDWSTKRDGMRA